MASARQTTASLISPALPQTDCKQPAWKCFDYSPGVFIQYERTGHGPVPILLLHGLAASSTTWDDLKPRFPGESYTLYLIDLAGSGRSSKPRKGDFYGPLKQADMLLAFLADQQLHGVFLIGHSFGGTLALLATLEARRSASLHLIKGLILIGSPGWPQPLPRFLRQLKNPFFGCIVMKLLPARFVARRALASVYHNRNLIDDSHVERYAECFRGPAAINALAQTVRQLIPEQWQDFCAGYACLNKPLLLIWGREDRIVRLWQGERLRETVQGARLVIIDHCGHNPHEECPDTTWRHIRQFLEEIEEEMYEENCTIDSFS